MSSVLGPMILAAARKDLVRRWRDPWALAMWIGIPLVIGGLIVLAMGGRGGPAPRAHVFVVDRDDSFLSRLLVSALSSERAKVIEAETLEESVARERMDAGEASALLVIPEGFGEAVLEERASTLELVTNPAQRILPAIPRSALEILCEGTFYLQRVVGDELKSIAAEFTDDDDALTDLRIAEASVRMRHGIERVAPLLFPPAITVETVIPPETGPAHGERSLASLYFPSMLLMALMFIAEGLADDVWRERELGALRRIAVGPSGAVPALLGKVLAGWVLMAAISAVALAIAVVVFDIAPARVPLALLWSSFAGAVLFTLMATLKLIASTQRAAGMLGNLLLFPLLMVGGSMIPFEAMPEWLRGVGRFTPNGWSMEILKGLIYGEPRPLELALAFVGLGAIGTALLACAALRMRSFARGGA